MSSKIISNANRLLAEFCTEIADDVAGQLNKDWAQLEEALQAGGHADELVISDEQLKGLFSALAGSDFVAQSMIRKPELLVDLLLNGDLLRLSTPKCYVDGLAHIIEGVADDRGLASQLRQFRRREMVRIAWRDFAGYACSDETLAELSGLADACLQLSLDQLYQWHCADFGMPMGEDSGTAQQLVVLGMGKLGARELNYSSDIDLIFAFPEQGETVCEPSQPNQKARRSLSNDEFFVRLGQRLIKVINENTADGFVFRVDMRLRPYGDSGPLAMSFDALEEYYQSQGREWERYAMVKARPVAGAAEDGDALMAMLKPFVFRRYLDYGSFESLREMKGNINRQVQRKGMQDNIKLGRGGIREIEFIGQAFQLIRAGREPALQIRPIKQVLGVLGRCDMLPGYAVKGLLDAYDFLRRTENHIQAYADEQLHDLPEDGLRQSRLALSMGFASWAEFCEVLDKKRHFVRDQFDQVMTAPQAEVRGEGQEDLPRDGLLEVWQGMEEELALAELTAKGFASGEEVLRRLEALRDSHAVRAMSVRGRRRLDCLMPMLLNASCAVDNPDDTLIRLVTLIEAVVRRSAYLALLVENPIALSQLVKLCAASPWIARQLSRHPLLLDELLDPRSLYAPSRGDELCDELTMLLAHIDEDDLERQMEILRQFKQATTLRVAAADVMGALPLMEVSNHLTEIAEVIVARVLALVTRQLAAKGGIYAQASAEQGFIVIAYGKMGGFELGYGSDLDLVFMHDSDTETALYPRLGQRIIHMFSTLTPAGILYEVDVRLRPSGASGLLVTSLDAFTEYQHTEAWTWEHQALMRARVVAGDPALAQRFNVVRKQILAKPREQISLRKEVSEMRERMRGELSKGSKGRFDIKQDPGGMTDIEFLVQYMVLLHTSEYPELAIWTDNIRVLDEMTRAGLVDEAEASILRDAYCQYRACGHALVLQEQPTVVDDGRFDALRDQVRVIWQKYLGDSVIDSENSQKIG